MTKFESLKQAIQHHDEENALHLVDEIEKALKGHSSTESPHHEAKEKFLLVAYQCYRHSDGMYHTPVGEFNNLEDGWEFIRKNGEDLGLNESEDGGGTYFYKVDGENYMCKPNGGFWFDTCSFFMDERKFENGSYTGDVPHDIYRKYNPY